MKITEGNGHDEPSKNIAYLQMLTVHLQPHEGSALL